MAEPIRTRLDRILDHLGEQGAKARRIVLSTDDIKELGDGGDYRSVPVEKGAIGQSSFIEAEGAPSGDANFGIRTHNRETRYEPESRRLLRRAPA